MPHNKTSWLTTVKDFFDKHPEREFYVGNARPNDLKEAAQALWLVGFASQPMKGAGFRRPDRREDQPTAPVVVRRPDPAGSQPNPGVIVLDGGMTLPIFPGDKSSVSRLMDGFGNFIWTASMETAAAGKSLKEALVATGHIAKLLEPPNRPVK